MPPSARRRIGPGRAAAGLALAMFAGLGAGTAAAANVTLAGTMGRSQAVLMIDGRPHTMAPGAKVGGVTLIRLTDQGADVWIDGRRHFLRPGDGVRGLQPAQAPGTPASGASLPGGVRDARIVLPVAADGHVMADGRINARPVRMLVDTGASLVTIGRRDAQQLGIDASQGATETTLTANGPVQGRRVVLPALEIQGVVLAHVDALVLDVELPTVLLGNSALSRFDLQRQGDSLRLQRRP